MAPTLRDHRGARRLAMPWAVAVAIGCNLPPLSGTPPPFEPTSGDSGDTGASTGTTVAVTLDASGTTRGGDTDAETTSPGSTVGSDDSETTGSGSGTTEGGTGSLPAWPPFNDCLNHDPADACSEAEFCLLDDPQSPGAGVCVLPCEDVGDCPFSIVGEAACVDFDGDGTSECLIECGAFGCLDDMACVDDAVCMWPEHGYRSCADDPDACLAGEACLQFDNPPWSVCSRLGCDGDVSVCPQVPPGGGASPACYLDWDVDGVADCTLDCSFGQDCPIGMTCEGNAVCAWLPEADLSCADEDLGAALGQSIATGSTVGAGDDFAPGCVGTAGPDWAMAWTAPYTGYFIFDSQDSNFDTVLYALAGCGGAELACNDDAVTAQASIAFFLQKNESIIIVMDGFGEGGDFALSIQ